MLLSRALLLACLAATAALRPTPTLRAPRGRDQRTRQLVAQYGQRVPRDDSYDAPPQGYTQQGTQHDYEQVCWRLVPAWGIFSEYKMSNGMELIIGRYDMAEQKPTVSRAQCIVQVNEDGTAILESLGKRPTGLRRHGMGGAPWYGLKLNAQHELLHGEQIALDMDSGESRGWQGQPYTAVFNVVAERVDSGVGFQQQFTRYPPNWHDSPQRQGYQQQQDYPPPYYDD